MYIFHDIKLHTRVYQCLSKCRIGFSYNLETCRSYVCAQRLTVWVLYFSGRRFVGSSENAWIPASLSLLHKITPYSQKRGVCPPKRPLFFNFMVLVESPKHPPFSMKIRTIVGSRFIIIIINTSAVISDNCGWRMVLVYYCYYFIKRKRQVQV